MEVAPGQVYPSGMTISGDDSYAAYGSTGSRIQLLGYVKSARSCPGVPGRGRPVARDDAGDRRDWIYSHVINRCLVLPV